MSAVAPYTGQSQSATIAVANLPNPEEGPSAMPPMPYQEPSWDIVPPPIYKTDLWSAQQTWPL
jgi:hypothetical protein